MTKFEKFMATVVVFIKYFSFVAFGMGLAYVFEYARYGFNFMFIWSTLLPIVLFILCKRCEKFTHEEEMEYAEELAN